MALVNAVAGPQSQSQSGGAGGQASFSLIYCAIFVALTIAHLAARQYAQIQTSEVIESILARVRERIVGKLRQVEVETIDGLGRQHISDTLSRDAFVVSEAADRLVRGASATVTLIFSAVYIATLSAPAFLMAAALVACAVIFYRRSQARSHHFIQRAREKETAFFVALDHFLAGFREITVNYWKGEDLFRRYLLRESRNARRMKVLSIRYFIRGANTSSGSFFALLGLVIFCLPSLGGDQGIVQKVTYVILFINTPLENLVIALPELVKANAAVANLRGLEERLDAALIDPDAPPSGRPPALREIVLKGLTYAYRDRDGGAFMVGPIDLTIRAGETVFITGGNGSGKSTLLRLLLRLNRPAQGELSWDGAPVVAANAADYRLLFSPIFSDAHLFDRLYGLPAVDPARVGQLLRELELDGKLTVADGRFSTLELSTGQRKRLALLVALLEDKPVLVFDEWAADQDPKFRRRFYEEFLPALKARGKTIIAVTHDDRYYKAADRVLELQEGKLAREDRRS